MEIKLTKTIARKVLKTVDAGLVYGLGKPIPGQMCIEAAVNYAMGLPHGDKPQCVGEKVRDFKIRLNDSNWASDKERAKGMRKLAIAQLGSDTIDQNEFVRIVILKSVQRALPLVLRNVIVEGKRLKIPKEHTKWDAEIEASAKVCEKVKTYEEAIEASKAARKIMSNANANAYANANANANAYAYANAYANANANARKFVSKMLKLVAQIGLEALIELKSPGVKWLGLCEK